MLKRLRPWRVSIALFACCFLGTNAHGQGRGPIARWSFASSDDASPRDSIRGVAGTLNGYYKYAAGVSGDALRFDGDTTSMMFPHPDAPGFGRNGFTVEAWVALNAYPWNWVPVVDQEKELQEGFFFGIDAFGHVGLQASVDGQWHALTSQTLIPLKKWAHIAGTYENAEGRGLLKIYLDGNQVGQMEVEGELTPSDVDILIGRVRRSAIPFPQAAVHPNYPIWYSLDGILDEVEMYDRNLTPQEIANEYSAIKTPSNDVLPWPKMPSGPAGPGAFGAYYTSLYYQDTWDRLRRVGPDSDVVVRFDESPIRLVFWQGTNYVPAWVTEDDKWYTDEFVETWGKGCPLGGDCEPMSDKQNRYSHVDILESDDARVVVRWRYALVEVEKYLGAWPDPQTGWFDWTDEYWTVYPDGVAVRKQVLHTTDTALPHEWQETIVLNQPGSAPDDDINWDAITLENMQGIVKTYTWKPKPAGSFTKPNGPHGVTGPQDPNIQIVNLKSQWKPFQIVSSDGASADIYDGENTYFNFECWNHWPVAQIASSGRPCVANDRASHTSLSHLLWKTYSKDENTETKILMSGLTTRSPADLLPLAKSWLLPPKMQVKGEDYHDDGYDPTQRAYVLTRAKGDNPVTLRLTLDGSEVSPVVDPAIVIKDWGDGGAQLKIDGRSVAPGRTLRLGHIRRLESTDLVIWIQKQSTAPLNIEMTAGSH
jgi:Concanavalin A-like lectin/glucanases superfamily